MLSRSPPIPRTGCPGTIGRRATVSPTPHPWKPSADQSLPAERLAVPARLPFSHRRSFRGSMSEQLSRSPAADRRLPSSARWPLPRRRPPDASPRHRRVRQNRSVPHRPLIAVIAIAACAPDPSCHRRQRTTRTWPACRATASGRHRLGEGPATERPPPRRVSTSVKPPIVCVFGLPHACGKDTELARFQIQEGRQLLAAGND